MSLQALRVAVVLLALSFACACGRPADDKAADSQKLPFDRQPSLTGISPSRTLIPSTTKLPEGTPISVHLESALSSASARAGGTFSAAIDDPVAVDGHILIARGTIAAGRVLEAKPAGVSPEAGYLRIVLESVDIDGKQIMIETSSIFAKGGSRDDRSSTNGAGIGNTQRDIVFGPERRLNFRLAQTVDLQ
jgi:hypothetical protein